ncbi:ABC transporter C-terminal domain-containing protein [Leisingera caerulea]|uniref:ABC transporter C-terminal domain-containing protein n=1 Tax=Leisingera caerulea TaxID=506591 RepID=UPI000424F48B|nr:ABC transporter C-terminal domain-containing protein [Leisingera caerulea]
MISVSDILKILDKAPIWTTLKEMPQRIEALEARVAELEAKPAKAEHLETCELCGKPAKVTDLKDHPHFGTFGVKLRTVTCEDGHSIEYKWDPNKQ